MSGYNASDRGLRSNSAMPSLPGVAALIRRHWDLTSGPAIAGCLCSGSAAPGLAPRALSSLNRTASTSASPARHGARYRAVHQERYNPLKIGYQSQDPRAKVRQDFGVRSVTWLACEAMPGVRIGQSCCALYAISQKCNTLFILSRPIRRHLSVQITRLRGGRAAPNGSALPRPRPCTHHRAGMRPAALP
jgi:hypothetical protein